MSARTVLLQFGPGSGVRPLGYSLRFVSDADRRSGRDWSPPVPLSPADSPFNLALMIRKPGRYWATLAGVGTLGPGPATAPIRIDVPAP